MAFQLYSIAEKFGRGKLGELTLGAFGKRKFSELADQLIPYNGKFSRKFRKNNDFRKYIS